jgi:hypothetical protein
MTPKEDQQPMTTREEMDRLADGLAFEARNTQGYLYHQRKLLNDAAAALRLASRQEVSVTVEELARFIDMRPGEPAAWASELARALLTKYRITKRTTEG